MNVIFKDFQPLIRIGYWNYADRFSKIIGPLLEFYKGDIIDVYFVVTDRQHPKIDPVDKPFPLTGLDVTIDIYQDVWDEDCSEPLLSLNVANGGVEILNEAEGFFRLHLTGEQSDMLTHMHHLFYVYFTDSSGARRTVLKEYIEMVR